MTTPAPDLAPEARELLTVTRGNPTPAELAAVVAILAQRVETADELGLQPISSATSGWGAKADLMRSPVVVGPGGWLAAARPR